MCRPTAGTGPRRPPFGSHCVDERRGGGERGAVSKESGERRGRGRRRRGKKGVAHPLHSLIPRVVKPQGPAVLERVGLGSVAGRGVVGHGGMSVQGGACKKAEEIEGLRDGTGERGNKKRSPSRFHSPSKRLTSGVRCVPLLAPLPHPASQPASQSSPNPPRVAGPSG